MRHPALLLLALGACSSSSGLPFSVNTNLATYPDILDDGGLNPSILVLVLAHQDTGPIDCAASFDGGVDFVGEGISIDVVRFDGEALTSGTYPVVLNAGDADGGPAAGIQQVNSDAGITYVATSGTVTLSTVGSTISGTVDAQMAQLLPGTNHYDLSTSFSMPLCLP
jgi:hypothetical protein